jgi:hypothetical protein
MQTRLLTADTEQLAVGPRKKATTSLRNILQHHHLVSSGSTVTQQRTCLRELLPVTPAHGVDVQQLLTRFTGVMSEHVIKITQPDSERWAPVSGPAPKRHSLDLLCVSHLLRILAPFRDGGRGVVAAEPLPPAAVAEKRQGDESQVDEGQVDGVKPAAPIAPQVRSSLRFC